MFFLLWSTEKKVVLVLLGPVVLAHSKVFGSQNPKKFKDSLRV